MHRRVVLEMMAAGAAALAQGLSVNQALVQELWCGIASREYAADAQIAVSLRQVSEELKECLANGGARAPLKSACGTFLQLGGMTRLDGLVYDPAGQDLILWGLADSDAEPLHLDDFVVALRSAFWKYPQTKDGKEIFYSPAISLDAVEPQWRQFNAMIDSGEIHDRFDLQTERGRADISEFCKTLGMRIRVDGLERHSRLAFVLVDADYRMKLVSGGAMHLNIKDPFPSADTALYRHWHYLSAHGRQSAEFKSHPTRFWFTPGEFRVEADWQNNIAHLKTSQILLRDAEQGWVDGAGESVDIDGANPFRRAFTCAWTERMDEVIESDKIWREMFNVFRHMAIARLIHDNDLVAKARFDASYLLEGHRIERYEMPDHITFVSDVRQIEEFGLSKHYGICGGVSVGFDRDTLVERQTEGKHRDLTSRIAGARPNADALSWML